MTTPNLGCRSLVVFDCEPGLLPADCLEKTGLFCLAGILLVAGKKYQITHGQSNPQAIRTSCLNRIIIAIALIALLPFTLLLAAIGFTATHFSKSHQRRFEHLKHNLQRQPLPITPTASATAQTNTSAGNTSISLTPTATTVTRVVTGTVSPLPPRLTPAVPILSPTSIPSPALTIDSTPTDPLSEPQTTIADQLRRIPRLRGGGYRERGPARARLTPDEAPVAIATPTPTAVASQSLDATQIKWIIPEIDAKYVSSLPNLGTVTTDLALKMEAYCSKSASSEQTVAIELTPTLPDHFQMRNGDYIFCIDTSGSMAGARIKAVITAARAFIRGLASTERVAFISWDDTAKILGEGLVNCTPENREKILGGSVREPGILFQDLDIENTPLHPLKPGGTTNLIDGIACGLGLAGTISQKNQAAGVQRPITILFFSDGEPIQTPSRNDLLNLHEDITNKFPNCTVAIPTIGIPGHKPGIMKDIAFAFESTYEDLGSSVSSTQIEQALTKIRTQASPVIFADYEIQLKFNGCQLKREADAKERDEGYHIWHGEVNTVVDDTVSLHKMQQRKRNQPQGLLFDITDTKETSTINISVKGTSRVSQRVVEQTFVIDLNPARIAVSPESVKKVADYSILADYMGTLHLISDAATQEQRLKLIDDKLLDLAANAHDLRLMSTLSVLGNDLQETSDLTQTKVNDLIRRALAKATQFDQNSLTKAEIIACAYASYIMRKHPAHFKAVRGPQVDTVLQNVPTGSFFLRPTRLGADHLVLSWKTVTGEIVHTTFRFTRDGTISEVNPNTVKKFTDRKIDATLLSTLETEFVKAPYDYIVAPVAAVVAPAAGGSRSDKKKRYRERGQ